MSLITGSSGRLLRISYWTASSTWTKQPDVGSVLVKVIGGGGGGVNTARTAGTSSSFGSHCTGGGGGISGASPGAGGSASGGDINLTGESGFQGVGGQSIRAEGYLGKYGFGGCSNATGNDGGGAGGYSEKFIQASALGATETVTVGSAGSGGVGGAVYAGGAGIVIIYEYSK